MTKSVRAFTLLELLLALAITSVLVVLLVNVVGATLDVWKQGRNRIDTFSSARQILDRMADEIKGARAAANQIEFSENVTFPEGPTFVAKTSENIFFVAPYPNIPAGDLCVIAYRHNSASHELQRAFRDSQAAWLPSATTRYRLAGYNFSATDWRTIAGGVIEFEIQSYSQQDLDSAVSPSPAPADSWSSTSALPSMVGNTPRQVTLRIKVVDDRTLVRLNLLTPGTAAYNQLVDRSAREFTANVALLPPH